MSYPVNRSQPLERALRLAEEEARTRSRNLIGPEDIVVGIYLEGEGSAAIALDYLGFNVCTYRDGVEKHIGRGEYPPDPEIYLSPTATLILDLGRQEANMLLHSTVGTGHVLRGLVREGKCLALGLIEIQAIDLRRLNELLLRELIARPNR